MKYTKIKKMKEAKKNSTYIRRENRERKLERGI